MNISDSNILKVQNASPSVGTEILLAVMQNNIELGMRSYPKINSKLKQLKNNKEGRAYLEAKLFDLKEIITNQKPIVKLFLYPFNSERERIYELIFSPLLNLQEFIEEKILLIDEFRYNKGIIQNESSKNSSDHPITNSAFEELKAYIDRAVETTNENTSHSSKDDSELLLRRSDVAKLFSVSLVTVSSWSKSGRLKSYRINSRVFFKKDEVMAAMKERGKRG